MPEKRYLTKKRYLGDGVYIDQDLRIPGAIVLTTENGLMISNTIYLEPEVLRALRTYLSNAECEQGKHVCRYRACDCVDVPITQHQCLHCGTTFEQFSGASP